MVHAGPLQKFQVHPNIHRGRLRSCDFMQNDGLSIQCIFLVELSKFKFSFILNAFLNAFINSEYINSNSNSRTIYGFLYRVFPEVWISFSDKISKTNPSTRLVSLNMGRNSEMGEVSLRTSSKTIKLTNKESN